MSMGAINALSYAINHSDRLSHLVIIDAGPEMRRPGSSRIRDFVNDVADAVSIEAIIERALQFNPRRDPNILRRSLMHNLRQQADGSWRWKYDRSRFQRLNQETHLAERARLADGLSAIACPTLVVRGGESDVFHDEDAERLASRLPNARWVKIPAPVTPCRATTRRGLSPSCAAFWRRGTEPANRRSPVAIPVRKTSAACGAEIEFDLSRPIDDSTFAELERHFHDNIVVFFRDQHLTEEQQIAFSRRFGELEIHIVRKYLLPDHPEILLISNIRDENGEHIGLADAGFTWHSDTSYRRISEPLFAASTRRRCPIATAGRSAIRFSPIRSRPTRRCRRR